MKKYFYFLLFALTAMVFTGCSSDDDFVPETPKEDVFTASIEEASRTALNGRKVTWIDGDVVNFVTDSKYDCAPYDVTPIGDGGMGLLSPRSINQPKKPYEAYYPADVWAPKEDGTYTSALPYRQDYDKENIISKVNPMYAKSDTTLLSFKNICGMLRLKLKGTAKVSRIQVTDGDNSLSGEFEMKNDMAVITANSSKIRSGIYLNCGKGIELKPEGTDFCISIPAGKTYNKLVIKVYDSSGKYYTMRISGAAVERNNIYTIEMEPKFKDLPAPVMPGVFTVSNDEGETTRTVCFSRGNLYWDAVNEKFDLEVNQQDYLPIPVREKWAHYEPSHVSHFYYTKYPEKSYADAYGATGESRDDIIFAHGMEMYGTTWQVLTNNEWEYLIDGRVGTDGKPLAELKETEIDKEYIYGAFLYPDDYEGNRDEDTWKEIEAAHIVILPLSGDVRLNEGSGSTVQSIGERGTYMAKLKKLNGNPTAFCFDTRSGTMNATTVQPNRGLSIRLVTPYNP